MDEKGPNQYCQILVLGSPLFRIQTQLFQHVVDLASETGHKSSCIARPSHMA